MRSWGQKLTKTLKKEWQRIKSNERKKESKKFEENLQCTKIMSGEPWSRNEKWITTKQWKLSFFNSSFF